jgi:hypothetical protein
MFRQPQRKRCNRETDVVYAGGAIAVYDPSRLIRASEVEYWRPAEPKSSLLFVLIVGGN